mgnify:CR=1 FL=1
MAQLLDSGKESLATRNHSDRSCPLSFREHAFEPFSNGSTVRSSLWTTKNEITTQLLNEWQTSADSLTMLITQVRMNEADKEAVYPLFPTKRERWLSLTVVISPTNGYQPSIRFLSDSLYLLFPDFLLPYGSPTDA